jgi:hypothetical protein
MSEQDGKRKSSWLEVVEALVDIRAHPKKAVWGLCKSLRPAGIPVLIAPDAVCQQADVDLRVQIEGVQSKLHDGMEGYLPWIVDGILQASICAVVADSRNRSIPSIVHQAHGAEVADILIVRGARLTVQLGVIQHIGGLQGDQSQGR